MSHDPKREVPCRTPRGYDSRKARERRQDEAVDSLAWWEWLLVPLGFGVGAYGTIVGAGGGFVAVPLLLILYPDEDAAAITSISLAMVFFNALSGSLAYARARWIDYRSGAIFAAASLPTAIAGAFLVDAIPRDVFGTMFGVALLSVALYMLWSSGRPVPVRPPLRGRFIARREMPGRDEGTTFLYSFNVLHGALLSFIIGLLSSLLGIGGGIFQVPAMISLLRFPVHVATATSQFVLLFMTGEASAVHLVHGDLGGVNLARAALLALGAVPGAQVGARLAHRMRGTLVARLLAAALLVVGARLVLSTVW